MLVMDNQLIGGDGIRGDETTADWSAGKDGRRINNRVC